MQIISISKIKPNPSNPRIIKDKKYQQLLESLKSFPEMATVRPIVLNQEMVILGGNMRYRAMKEAGWKEVPVEIVDWSEDKQKEFIIKDNVGFGEWDWDVLANEWDADELLNWGLDIPEITTVDELEEEEEKEGTFPLSITLNIIEFKKWQNYKKTAGYKSDTDAFKESILKLIN